MVNKHGLNVVDLFWIVLLIAEFSDWRFLFHWKGLLDLLSAHTYFQLVVYALNSFIKLGVLFVGVQFGFSYLVECFFGCLGSLWLFVVALVRAETDPWDFHAEGFFFLIGLLIGSVFYWLSGLMFCYLEEVWLAELIVKVHIAQGLEKVIICCYDWLIQILNKLGNEPRLLRVLL